MVSIAIKEECRVTKGDLESRGLLPGFPQFASTLNGQAREVLALAIIRRAHPKSRRFTNALEALFLNYKCGKPESGAIISYLKANTPERYHKRLCDYDTEEKRECRRVEIALKRQGKLPLCIGECNQKRLVRGEGKAGKPKRICLMCGQIHVATDTRGKYNPTGRQIKPVVLKRIETIGSIYR